MTDYELMTDIPVLTKNYEEFQMLIEVAEEYKQQHREKTAEKKSSARARHQMGKIIKKTGEVEDYRS